MDPITLYNLQQQRNNSKIGESVEVEAHTVTRRRGTRVRKRSPSNSYSPSPTNRTRYGGSGASGDVFAILGIATNKDYQDQQTRKQELMKACAEKIQLLTFLSKKKSPAQLSNTKGWPIVARALKRGHFTKLANGEEIPMSPKRSFASYAGEPMSPTKRLCEAWGDFNIADNVEEDNKYRFKKTIQFALDTPPKKTGLAGAEQVCALRWNSNDSRLAVAHFDGYIRVYDMDKQTKICQTNLGYIQKKGSRWVDTSAIEAEEGQHENEFGLPLTNPAVTNIRWFPTQGRVSSRSKISSHSGNILVPSNILVSASTEGILTLWDVTDKNGLRMLHCYADPDDDFYGLDWTCDGQFIVAAGRGKVIKVFDRELNPVSMQWEQKWDGVTGHRNRVISLRTHPSLPNIIFSAGFDRTVQVWDLHLGSQVSSIVGPLVDGDSLDVSHDGSLLLTGSSQSDEQIEIWDWRKSERVYGSRIATVTAGKSDKSCNVTCAGFSKDACNRFVHVAGVHEYLARSFNSPLEIMAGKNVEPEPLSYVSTLSGINVAFRSLESSRDGNKVAYGTSDGSVTVCGVSMQ